ncbi:MAG: flagellar basal body rod protein FlgB [Armatimonadetes bacterium]|nr:flagellar basal body rod protein FlgB [Armatimonadota bacterium]
MRPLDGLFGPTSRNIEHAMGRATQRHALLTENLANVNVPGYKRRDVDFGIELEQAEGEAQSPLDKLQGRLSGHMSHADGSVRIDGNSVDMEQEVAGIGETEVRYEMLSELASRYFGGLKSVIREGR